MSDGTEAGTVLVRDIYPGIAGPNPRWLTNVGGTLYFVADNRVNGRELWKSDGTKKGTVLAYEFVSGDYGADPRYIIEFNGRVVVAATTHVFGEELWIQKLLPGDFNRDNIVDDSDYKRWRRDFGKEVPPWSGADGNGDGVIGPADYTIWRNNLGASQLAGGGAGSLAAAPLQVAPLTDQFAPAEAPAAIESTSPGIQTALRPSAPPLDAAIAALPAKANDRSSLFPVVPKASFAAAAAETVNDLALLRYFRAGQAAHTGALKLEPPADDEPQDVTATIHRALDEILATSPGVKPFFRSPW
jgi:ELWxxDGT repeat protein